jgi:hypothetical protein
MKASLLTLLLIFSSLSITMAQKKYMVKVTTLDNKVYKGLMFQVRDKDFLVLPNSARWDFKVKEKNISRTKVFDFGIVKDIKIRKRGSFGKGALIGFVIGTTLSVIAAKSFAKEKSLNFDSRLLGGMAILLIGTSASPIIGGAIGGSYPHQFEVKKDSTSIQSLKVELKKYEWYHAEEGMTNNK